MIALAVGPSPSSAENRDKVLVVFSYERDSLWEIEIRKGLEDVLSDQAELTFFLYEYKGGSVRGTGEGRGSLQAF